MFSTERPTWADPTEASAAAAARAKLAPRSEHERENEDVVARILSALGACGFPKAHAAETWSVFERVLGGLCWLLQLIVKREDAQTGRVQWDLLFHPHEKMRPRLQLAQEVVKRVEALPLGCPIPIQPHQLLLQDFGDVGTVYRLVKWLIEQAQEATHLTSVRVERRYLDLVATQEIRPDDDQASRLKRPLAKEVVYLQAAYRPRRRYKYTTEAENESEDAMIQRCLLEYGERVEVAATPLHDGDQSADDGDAEPGDVRHKMLAQLASQAASMAGSSGAGGRKSRTRSEARRKDPRAAEFDAQYEKAVKQAMREQQELLQAQQAREQVLLQQVVSVAADPAEDDNVPVSSSSGSALSQQLAVERRSLQEQETQVQRLITEKRRVDTQRKDGKAQALALDEALATLEHELTKINVQEDSEPSAQQQKLAILRKLVVQNESLKRQQQEFRSSCRLELERLEARVAQLQQETTQDALHKDEEALRLQEIEQMHVHMTSQHTEMRRALAQQTRSVHLMMKQIDAVPTRVELMQYEKRFLELYDEVALTLEETRKYYGVYNTLKTTQTFLQKEISLIDSIYDNVDVAMKSKAATQAFFSQLDGILQNVDATRAKQQSLREEHQQRVETLDSKYQVLLENERTYVTAIRAFQKECERNERLSVKLQACLDPNQPE